ncbi:nitrilase-related carbon-nitrogen hydrolase [Nonomuraea ceibae]|uniref:nitrilase-related carbon-nitrogen hydrolase n=1 Tax=Nonomuraea ceibae TaxID=1935170 RepID=UPI001C5D8E76|nr:nitrilase-related carbon-nitrogen hydrolase [Nonomuraea ceibae]
MRRALIPLVAALASAVLLHFGTGLHPVAWLTWLAPLPVLVAAPRVGAGLAFASGALAWLGGQLQLWPYFAGTLEMPALVAAGLLGGPALLYGLGVLLHRSLLARRRPLTAALAVPALWVGVEYLMARAGPHGAWWSLAYTQADVLPVLQTASVTGVWGITFLLLFAPAAVAALLAPGATHRLHVAVTAGALAALVAAYGFTRLGAAQDGEGHRTVALISTDHPRDTEKLDSPQGRDLLRRYGQAVDAAAARGAEIVVLPEKTFEADTPRLPPAGPGVEVVTGVALGAGATRTNTALATPTGVRYDKHHLIPGLESEFTPGRALAFLDRTTLGLIICKDLDFPWLVRQYRQAGATALLAPAWDFDDDAWLHSRMAMVRGVESGLSVARAARQGFLTVSDTRGRVLAEARSGEPGVNTANTANTVNTVYAALPRQGASTVYTSLGDWAAWSSIALLIVALARLRTRQVGPHGLRGVLPGQKQ